MLNDLPAECDRDRPGRKRVELGRNIFICDASRFLLTSLDLPVVSRVIEASEKVPCLALSLKLEMPVVRELLSREEIEVAEAPADSPGMAIGETHGGIPQCVLPTREPDAPRRGTFPFSVA